MLQVPGQGDRRREGFGDRNIQEEPFQGTLEALA